MKEYFYQKMDEIIEKNPRLKKALIDKMEKTIETSKKLDQKISKVIETSKEISSIKWEIQDFNITNTNTQEELNDEKSINKLEDDLKWDKIKQKIFLLLKNITDKTNWIKLFRRGNTKLFWLKNSSQIVVIGDNFNIKIKRDDIKVWDNERDEKWKVIKMSNEEFEEYLENEWLKYFIGKLKINPYWKSLDTIDNYRWVKLDFKYVEDEKFSENFEKLLEAVVENNK